MKRIIVALIISAFVASELGASERERSPRYGEGLPGSRYGSEYDEMTGVYGRRPRVQAPQAKPTTVSAMQQKFNTQRTAEARKARLAERKEAEKRARRPRNVEYATAYRYANRQSQYQKFKDQDLAAYEQLRPLSAKRRFVYTQAKDMTPEIAEAYEQGRRSAVKSSLPQRSWTDYFKEKSGLSSDIYAAQRRTGEGLGWARSKMVMPDLGIQRRVSSAYSYVPSREQWKDAYSAMTAKYYKDARRRVTTPSLGERVKQAYYELTTPYEDDDSMFGVYEEAVE